MRGNGLLSQGAPDHIIECEAFLCGANNTATHAGFGNTGNGPALYTRCISHDNAGTNIHGFYVGASALLDSCIADTNGADGINTVAVSTFRAVHCDCYNNVGDGIDLANTATIPIHIESCNLVKNGGWGINGSGAGARHGYVVNCGFGNGGGTEGNTSGTTTGLKSMQELGSITYVVNVNPWVDPATGDFRINLAAAINAGRGTFTQTQASYTGAIGYPDIGASQHLEAAASSGGGAAAEFLAIGVG